MWDGAKFPEEVFGGDEEVEPAIFLDGGGEAAGIDEGGADGRAVGKGEGFGLAAANQKNRNSGRIFAVSYRPLLCWP